MTPKATLEAFWAPTGAEVFYAALERIRTIELRDHLRARHGRILELVDLIELSWVHRVLHEDDPPVATRRVPRGAMDRIAAA